MDKPTIKISLKRIRLNQRGFYQGIHYGGNTPWYEAFAEFKHNRMDSIFWKNVQGKTREQAKKHALAHLKIDWPGHTGTFYR